MTLIDHAKRELELAKFISDDSENYEQMIGAAVLELIEVFAAQGHSGYSAASTLRIFQKLASFEALSPLTNDPDEWMNVQEYSPDTKALWQSKRTYSCFSTDNGETYYNVDDEIKTITDTKKTCIRLN